MNPILAVGLGMALLGLGAAPAIIPPNNAVRALVRRDAHGDPLPPGALARLGRVDLGRHGSDIRCLAVSPDGRRVATGSADRSVCVWDAATGREQRCWSAHGAGVRALAFAPDGKALASTDGETVRVWDAATGKQLVELDRQDGVYHVLAFSPNGKTLATGALFGERRLRLWDAVTGRECGPCFACGSAVMGLAFSADGRRLFAASTALWIGCWSVDSGAEIVTPGHHQSAVQVLRARRTARRSSVPTPAARCASGTRPRAG